MRRDYQRVIRDALGLLFSPPLDPPIWESGDASRANVRDIVLPNYASEGFWKDIRETYSAHYIVVDAKNYKGKISKQQALQVANYLKPEGAGLFAIIASRNGATRPCEHTLREQWVAYGKMVVLLTDKDIVKMLLASGANRNPEDVLGEVIRDFRLSI